MMASFRHMASGIVAKILLGFLVFSFGLWGIGDIFRGSHSKPVASVDGESIRPEELQGFIETLQRSYPEITAEMAADPAFRTEALNSLINRHLMKNFSHALGLEFSSETLAEYIAQNPSFRNEDGSFNRDHFIETLRQNNMTERAFLSRFGQDLATSFIEDTFAVGWLPSEQMLGLYHFLRNEKREGLLLTVSSSQIKDTKKPSTEDLKRLYSQQQDRFTIPEMRSFRYAAFDTDTAQKALNVEVDDATLHQLYAERKDSFVVPEKREVDQLLFLSEDAATSAAARLDKGTAWKDLAKDASVTNKDSVALGQVSMTDLPAEAAEPVFALAAGSYSSPIKTGFGWHIFYVRHITPAHSTPFEEAKAQLQKEYRAEQSEQKMTDLANALEDAIAAGSDMKDALSQVGLKNVTIAQVGPASSAGQSTDGKALPLSALEHEALQQAFSLNEGETSGINLAEDQHYYVVQTTQVTPESVRPLKEVRSELETLYHQRALQMALHDKAAQVAKALKEAENPDQAARDMGYTLTSLGMITSDQESASAGPLKDKALTQGLVHELFRLKLHEATAPYPLPDGDYAVAVLNAIEPAKPATPEELSALEKEFTATMAQEAMFHTIAYLRKHYDVQVNTDVLYPASSAPDQKTP